MVIDDPAELKLIEKFRDIMSKKQREGDAEITRTFTMPDLMDSDVLRHISVGLRRGSGVSTSTSEEMRVERARIPEKFRPGDENTTLSGRKTIRATQN